jgi:peroxiredoxin
MKLMSNRLLPDMPVPELALPLAGGGDWNLKNEKPNALTMIVVYRGYHCPICKSYLGKLEKLLPAFEKGGASVIAISMDGAERAELAKQEWGLEKLRIAYGMSADKAREWGLYLSKSVRPAELEIFPEPGLFWVRPDGRLYLVDIGSMPFARPDLELLVERVPRINEGYPARGTYRDG